MTQTAANLSILEIPGVAKFRDTEGGLVRLDLTTPLASAAIYLQGAHVAEFTPSGAAPVLFMSKEALLAPGKAIRGGVPVIFPWFGPNTANQSLPAHGFVRTSPWTVESVVQEPSGEVLVTLEFADSPETMSVWPHAFRLRYRIRVGAKLEMNLHVENRGTETFTYEEALHTYLAVSDAREVKVHGLADVTFIDKVDNLARKVQDSSPIQFTGETDRVYLETYGTCIAEDPGLNRRLIVEKEGSATTVVWNPWIKKAAAMADFGDEEWPGMVCIETANAADNAITLAPGSEHVMRAVVSVAY
jgi:D-hexose-6-phosphate mutarotase